MIDCGGGTVDLVVHSMSRDPKGFLQVKEVRKDPKVSSGTGGLCGGTYVDQEFINRIKEVFRPIANDEKAPKSFEEWKAKFPTHFLKMMSNWSAVKHVCYHSI